MRVAGVLERIRQRLLDDAVRRQLDTDRQVTPLAFDAQVDRQPCVADLRDQQREVVETRLRCERIGSVAAQHPDQAAHLGQRTPADLLDRLQNLARRAVVRLEHPALGAGLDDHHRDVVRDRVVQLARDPRSLLDDRLSRDDVPLALGQLDSPLAVSEHAPHEQHDDERDDRERRAVAQRRARPDRRP